MGEIDELKEELLAIAEYWRSDWTGFDGRTLKFQIESVLKEFDNGKVGHYHRDMLAEQGRR